jgi:hypothetical protein
MSAGAAGYVVGVADRRFAPEPRLVIRPRLYERSTGVMPS